MGPFSVYEYLREAYLFLKIDITAVANFE